MTVTAKQRKQGLDHVFVPTDFSPGARRALARAARLAIADGGRITLMHVLPSQLTGAMRVAAEKAAKQKLSGAATLVRRAMRSRGNVTVEEHVVHGAPHVEIVRRARLAGADLIVLGRHGRHPIRDMFIGSTAERVARSGDLPVLIVQQPAARRYTRLLVAVDLEDASRSVVETALRVVGPTLRDATMVHGYQVPFEGFIDPGALPGTVTDLRREMRAAAQRRVQQLQTAIGDVGVPWHTLVVRGDPRAVVIVEEIRTKPQLIAVGTHARSGLAHALIGSVAESIVRSASCDVLVARATRVTFELP